MTTCVSLVVALALSSAAPTVAAPTVPSSPPLSPRSSPSPTPLVDVPDELPPRVPGTGLPPPPAAQPAVPPATQEVSLGAGWAGSQTEAVSARAGSRIAISPDDIAVWAPPPEWAPPPAALDRYEGSEEWRTLHLGLAIAVEIILTSVALGLTLNRDPDPIDDGRLPPRTQFDAFFPR